MENFNFFPNEIIETEEQEFVILVFTYTLLKEEQIVLKEEDTNDIVEAPIKRLNNYLSEKIYKTSEKEKIKIKLDEYNQSTIEDEKINFDYSLKNYRNITLYIKKNLKKDQDHFFIYVLEFCFVVAFQSILK